MFSMNQQIVKVGTQILFLVVIVYAILRSMTPLDLPADRLERLHHRLTAWSGRLRALGIESLVGAVLDAAEPLGPLGAQVLWVAQPALGLIVPRDDVDGFARILDNPSGMAWLRATLLDETSED